MKTLKYERENYEDILQLTETEQDAIDAYQSASFASINELLIADNGEYVLANKNGKGMTVFGLHNELIADKRVELIRQGLAHDDIEKEITNFEKEKIEHEKAHVGRLLDVISNIYIAAEKESVMTEKNAKYYSTGFTYNRGTSQREIDSYTVGGDISNPISTTTEEYRSSSHFLMFANEEQNRGNAACLSVNVSSDVPRISMNNFNGEKEVLVAPFTTIEQIRERGQSDFFGGKIKSYDISLKPVKLELLPEEESTRLREEIISETEEISEYMSSIYRWDGEIKRLEQKAESYYNKQKYPGIDDEEYNYYEEKIKSIKNRVDICKKEMSANFTKVKKWKSKIITYTKSETRRKELEFEAQIQAREEKIQKQIEEEAKRKEEIQKRNEKLKDIRNSLEKENIRVPGYGSFESILDIDERIKKGLKNISYFSNDTEIAKFKNNIFNLKNTLTKVMFKEKEIAEEDLVILENIAKEAGDGTLGKEIQDLSRFDQNYLKQRVFDSFKSIVEEKETSSLKQELDTLNEKDKKKGIARIFQGPSKAEKKRMAELNEFFDNYHRNNEKGDRVYSVRNIVAEMEIFVEDYSAKPEYLETITQVNELKEILDSTFSYSRDDLERIKNERRANISGTDLKVERILRLDKEEKDAPQITAKPKCPGIEKIKQIELRMRNKNKNRERNQNYDHEN